MSLDRQGRGFSVEKAIFIRLDDDYDDGLPSWRASHPPKRELEGYGTGGCFWGKQPTSKRMLRLSLLGWVGCSLFRSLSVSLSAKKTKNCASNVGKVGVFCTAKCCVLRIFFWRRKSSIAKGKYTTFVRTRIRWTVEGLSSGLCFVLERWTRVDVERFISQDEIEIPSQVMVEDSFLKIFNLAPNSLRNEMSFYLKFLLF